MRRRLSPLVLLLCVVSLAACSGSLFKVKPVAQLPPLPEDVHRVEGGGVQVKVGRPLTDEESHELFEVNLPLVGILAFRTELNFQGGETIEVKKLRFRVRDQEGHDWKFLNTKDAVSRILKANDIVVYNPNSRKQFLLDIESYSLNLKSELSASQPRQAGFIFFQSPAKTALQTHQPLTLTIERLPQPLTVQLN
jgi:hypothetical protein